MRHDTIACNGKARYDSKKEAMSVINHFLRTKRGRHGSPEALRCYPCPKCGNGWHLTKERRA